MPHNMLLSANMITLGITGTIGAGKGTIVEYLKTKGFTHYSVRDALLIEINRRGIEPTREHMRLVADEMRQISPDHIMKELLRLAQEKGGNSVIESQRALAEVEFLKATAQPFYLFAVDADSKVRYERILERKSSTDFITYEKFVADEQAEMNNVEPWKMNLKACIAAADFVFENNGSVEDLYKKVEEILQKIK